jgi:hypothetical protein
MVDAIEWEKLKHEQHLRMKILPCSQGLDLFYQADSASFKQLQPLIVLLQSAALESRYRRGKHDIIRGKLA